MCGRATLELFWIPESSGAAAGAYVRYPSSALQAVLAARAAEFRFVIDRLRGKEEWGVYIYCDRTKLIENKVSNNSAIRQLLNRAASASPGQSYLLSKQVEGLKAEAAIGLRAAASA